jgi:hypothetical protein
MDERAKPMNGQNVKEHSIASEGLRAIARRIPALPADVRPSALFLRQTRRRLLKQALYAPDRRAA